MESLLTIGVLGSLGGVAAALVFTQARHRPRHVLLFALILICTPQMGWPQPLVPPFRDQGTARGGESQTRSGTARVSGRVIALDTRRPIRRALIRMTGTGTATEPHSVSSDPEGRWELHGVPAGRYTVTVAKAGYVTMAYGQLRPFEQGKVLDVADGQIIEKLDVALPRAGVITGQVVDEFGDPVGGARVAASRHRFVQGQRRLTAMSATDVTDDVGHYRLHGLAPGEYYVSAALPSVMFFERSADRSGYLTTYYPSTPSEAEARRVRVAIGEEVPGANISLVTTRFVSISGTAVTSSGQIFRGVLSLRTASGAPAGRSTMLNPDGTFTFSAVTAGDYRLEVPYIPDIEALASSGSNRGITVAEFGSVEISVVDKDVTGVHLVTSPAAKASGRVVFEGAAQRPARPETIGLAAAPVTAGMFAFGGSARIRDDWTFEATGLWDRRRFRISPLPAGWFLKSVTHDGTDITDAGLHFKDGQTVSGIDIVLTQRSTDLSGTVQDANGARVADYVIVAFSSDSTKWGYETRFVQAIRPNQEGRFSIKGLPPGDYLAIALEYLETGDEADPEQLERWRPLATSIGLANAEAKTVTLKLARPE